MKEVKVYLASKNLAKLEAVNEVFNEYEVIGVSGESKVKAQPLSIEETIKGAFNRAKGINYPQSIRLGLEAGVAIIDSKCFLINFGVLIDENDNEYYAGGSFIPLPDAIASKLYNDKVELKDLMIDLTGIENINNHGGAISILTDHEVKRKDIFVHICKLLFGQMKANKNKK